MDLKKRIQKVHSTAYDYDSALKRINRSQAEVDQLRKMVENEKLIPDNLSDKQVRE